MWVGDADKEILAAGGAGVLSGFQADWLQKAALCHPGSWDQHLCFQPKTCIFRNRAA